MNMYYLVSLVLSMCFFEFIVLTSSQKLRLWNRIDKNNRIFFRIFVWFSFMICMYILVDVALEKIAINENMVQVIEGAILGMFLSFIPDKNK